MRDRICEFIRSPGGVLIGLVLVGFALRLVVALSVYGTEDIWTWGILRNTLVSGQNPYQHSPILPRWPPLWLITIFVVEHLARVLHIDFVTLIKIPPILADVAIAVTIYYYFTHRRKAPDKGRFYAALYVINPISILAIVAHGQFDSIPTLFVLLSLYYIEADEKEANLLFSAIFLSLAIFAKGWPLLLVPLFLARVPRWGSRVAFLITALLPYVVSMATLFVLTPSAILNEVVLYRSGPGWWGLTSFYSVVPNAVTKLIVDLYSRFGAFVLLTALVGIAFYYYRLRRIRDVDFLEAITGGILLFYVLTPGYGTQYLAWIAPFALIYSATHRFARYFFVLVSIVLAIEYTFRPYACGLFEWIAVAPYLRSECFRTTYATPMDQAITNILNWPMWLFCGFFLARILGGWRRPVVEGARSLSD